MAVKDALTSNASKAKLFTRERWQAFRAESPYFQAKVGLVALYVVVVLFTVLLAPPSAEPWKIEQKRIPFGLAFKTAVEIWNVSNGDIEEAVIEVRGKGIEFDGKEIPGVWRTKPLVLLEDEERPTKIQTEQLFDAKGLSPPYSLVVELVTVFDEDDVLVRISPPPPRAQP
jgi:hypothetical protein